MVEVMGAILVIGIGVAASYYIVQQIISYTFASSSRLTAAYLAEEGVEIVRNIRDTNWVSNNVWNAGLGSGTYQADYNNYSLSGYAGSYAKYSTGTNSKFQRRISLANQIDGSIKVTVDVMWQELGSVKTLTVQSYLYGWLQQ